MRSDLISSLGTIAFVLTSLLPVAAWSRAVVEPISVHQAPNGRPPPVANSLNIATLNIAHGRGSAINQLLVSTVKIRGNLEKIADFLKEKDIHIIALQEADAPSWWSGKFDHSQLLAEKSGFGWYASSPHANLGIGHYGTAVLSILPLTRAASHSFPPSPPTARKGFTLAEATWAVAGKEQRLDIISIHMDFSRKSVRQTQLSELRRAIEGRTNPLIIMGDFNSESIARQLISEENGEERYMHTLEDTGSGWHSYKDKRLDWILISNELEFIDYQTVPAILSDHRLLTARIRPARSGPAKPGLTRSTTVED